MAMCYNPPLVRDKSLGVPASVKLVYLCNISPHNKYEIEMWFKKYDFSISLELLTLCAFLWNCAQLCARTPHWWYVNAGWDNGLVLSGSKSLTEQVLARIGDATDITGHSKLTHKWPGQLF